MVDSISELSIGSRDIPTVASAAKIGKNEEEVIIEDRNIAKEHTSTQGVTDNYQKEIGEVNLNIENSKNTNTTTNQLQNNEKKITQPLEREGCAMES